jgi:hypothetical protein
MKVTSGKRGKETGNRNRLVGREPSPPEVVPVSCFLLPASQFLFPYLQSAMKMFVS